MGNEWIVESREGGTLPAEACGARYKLASACLLPFLASGRYMYVLRHHDNVPMKPCENRQSPAQHADSAGRVGGGGSCSLCMTLLMHGIRLLS